MSKLKMFLAVCLLIFFSTKTFAAFPKRIVSLKPNITEILFALGAGDRLVGVTTYCDYPPAAEKIVKVADYTRPFTESLIAQRPDLIISSKEESSKKSIEEIEKLGIRVELFPFTTLGDIISSVKKISVLIGNPKSGEELVRQMTKRLDTIKRQYGNRTKKKVLIVWGHKPLIVGGPGTYMDDVLRLVSAVNVVPKGSVPYPRWNLERVIAANPDVILDMSMIGGKTDNFWKDLNTVNAVNNNEIHFLNVSNFRASPRLYGGIWHLGALIHPCNCKKK